MYVIYDCSCQLKNGVWLPDAILRLVQLLYWFVWLLVQYIISCCDYRMSMILLLVYDCMYDYIQLSILCYVVCICFYIVINNTACIIKDTTCIVYNTSCPHYVDNFLLYIDRRYIEVRYIGYLYMFFVLYPVFFQILAKS